MLIAFVDILYAVVIATGFMVFPRNPFSNILGTVVFIYTLIITAHDWFEYHHKADIVPEHRRLLYFIIQIFVILTLNQMFVYSVTPSLIPWLIYGGIFCLLNTLWNIITPFEKHFLYAGTSAFLSIMAFLLATFYRHIINFSLIIDGKWLIFVLSVIIPIGTLLFEYRIERE